MATKETLLLEEGDKVILPELDNGDEIVPAQRAEFISMDLDTLVFFVDGDVTEVDVMDLPSELEVWND